MTSQTPAQLSDGMVKYALALALSHGAQLLILDEPTSGIDPVSREELVNIFLSSPMRKDGVFLHAYYL
ncbi:MAG: AAA family ATPase [Christensenellaceae bacterium]